ncbi:glycosyltransferase family 4 protein [Phytohabitans houttuyneae]|uniref:Glycosyltransferase WbuB n=1 Tax=Phytohabitans houttuyneae TaxID=1076126 RepID=A0A6V8JZY3_9ACTN|nr:glycosyltransferase family 4 protein [Phytohabitans houttuyneae]GFJ78372.1 glycosyltransferase WbuB [Phytohabitans houttuyneae]
MKNRRANITILIANLPAERDRRVIRECLSLEEAGYEVTVIAPRGDKSLKVLPGSRNTRLRPYPVFVYGSGVLSFATEFIWSFLCIAVRLLGEVFAGRAQAVQVCNPPDVYWPLALMMRAMGRPWVFDHHDLCPEVYATRSGGQPNRWVYRMLELLEWLTLRTASAVFATNESFRDNALRRGVPEEKVTVVRNGPALGEIAPAGPDGAAEGRHGEHHLVYLGVLGPQDNVEGTVLAAEELTRIRGRAGWRLSIAGDGESLPALRKLVADRGLGDVVEFTGWLDGQAVDDLLRTATVAIQPDLPTTMNHLSTMAKTVEYVARGLPVVAADLVETRRTADEAAIYVPNGTPLEYAMAIDELLRDRERREKMREVGLTRFADHLAWEHQAREYLKVWHRLLARRPVDPTVPRPRTSGPGSSRVAEPAGRE